jgi:hypothetical protein
MELSYVAASELYLELKSGFWGQTGTLSKTAKRFCLQLWEQHWRLAFFSFSFVAFYLIHRR